MNIVITGAGRGIGFETAKLLSASHQVVAISRNRENLQKLAGESSVLPLAFDLASTDFQDVTAMVEEKLGSVDILINNAGELLSKPFPEITAAELNHIYNVNVFAPFRLIQALLPFMAKSQPCHIVNIGSMGGFQGSSKFPGLSVYSSSKAALANLTECLAEELKWKNIFVNCLALGSVQTEMLNEAFPGYQAPVTAGQMAKFIAEFSVDGYKYFNGKILPVSINTP